MTASTQPFPAKPTAVLYAEWALWLWTTWACLFGLYQSWGQVAEIETAIADQLQGMITVQPSTLISIIVVGYGIVAVTSVWVILKIGEGKHWARTSLAAGFVLDAIYTAFTFEPGWRDVLTNLADFGPQLYAIYLLYTEPGRGWFKA